MKKGIKKCLISAEQSLKLGFTWCMGRKNGNGKSLKPQHSTVSESSAHHSTPQQRQNSGQTTIYEENKTKSSHLRLFIDRKRGFSMLNDDLLIELGEQMLSRKDIKGDLVKIKGFGDGFFFDPVNKMMICILAMLPFLKLSLPLRRACMVLSLKRWLICSPRLWNSII